MENIKNKHMNLINKIKDSEDGFLFVKEDIALEKTNIEFNELSICKGFHPYGESVLVDMLLFFASKEDYQYLGLCLFGFILSKSQSNLEIHLKSTKSEVNLLRVINPSESHHDKMFGINYSLDKYTYFTHKISNDVFGGERDDRFLPRIILTDEEGRGIVDRTDKRNVAILDCGLMGIVNFASLLLDFGQASNNICELALEAYPGSKSVAKTSAEMILNLPGSDWWNFE